MFKFNADKFNQFKSISEFWGDKMPIMACEEFSELTYSIVEYRQSMDAPSYLREVATESADAVISLFAVAHTFGINLFDVYSYANYFENLVMFDEELYFEDVIERCANATITISKKIRKPDSVGDVRLKRVFGELLLAIYYMISLSEIKDQFAKALDDKMREVKTE